MLAIFSITTSPTRLKSITSCRLCSLSIFPALVVRDSVAPDPARLPLAAIEAYVCADGGDMEMVSSCDLRELIVSWKCCCSFLNATRSVLTLLTFWFAITLLCCTIVSFRFAMSAAPPPNPVLLSTRLGKRNSRVVENGGNPSCTACSLVDGSSFCAVRSAVIRTLGDC